MRVVIVADDFKGYKGYSKYIGQKGTIVGWKPNPDRTDDGKIPIIKLDSEQTLCDKRVWWNNDPLCDTCLHYCYEICVVNWKRNPRIECDDYFADNKS